MPKWKNPEEVYLKIKRGDYEFIEDEHCPMIIDIMNTKGTMAAFCKEVCIGDSLFYKWIKKYPVFKECYEYGKMLSRANWEEEGERGKNDENFNIEHWRIIGSQRYGLGRTSRIRLEIDENADPYLQYKQLIRQAGTEEFSAQEIKQISEVVNVGRALFETVKLQADLEQMRQDLNQMRIIDAEPQRADEQPAQAD